MFPSVNSPLDDSKQSSMFAELPDESMQTKRKLVDIIERSEEDMQSSRRPHKGEGSPTHSSSTMGGAKTAFPVTNMVQVDVEKEPVRDMLTHQPSLNTGKRNKYILVAEDSQINLTLLRHLLEKSFNFTANEVVYCKDGGQALERIKKNLKDSGASKKSDNPERADHDELDDLDDIMMAPNNGGTGSDGKEKLFDLIILDYHMPVLNGLEVFAGMQAFYREHSAIMPPVAFMTAMNDPNFKKECFAKGVDYFLTKPAPGDVLKKLFEQVKLL